VENLAHSASLHAGENGAPSKPGIKHLARHEVHFDRRIEKKLTMLLTLQERRLKIAEKSVLQNLSETAPQ
jgi:hypothetical protein